MKVGRKPEYSEKTLDVELEKMQHIKARKLKPQTRLEPTLKHWWQAIKADVLIIIPRVAPNISIIPDLLSGSKSDPDLY